MDVESHFSTILEQALTESMILDGGGSEVLNNKIGIINSHKSHSDKDNDIHVSTSLITVPYNQCKSVDIGAEVAIKESSMSQDSVCLNEHVPSSSDQQLIDDVIKHNSSGDDLNKLGTFLETNNSDFNDIVTFEANEISVSLSYKCHCCIPLLI